MKNTYFWKFPNFDLKILKLFEIRVQGVPKFNLWENKPTDFDPKGVVGVKRQKCSNFQVGVYSPPLGTPHLLQYNVLSS